MLMSGMKKCFIICPIGTEDSETRRAADELMELIVEPALQMYKFEVIRADRIPRPAVITSDIIDLVQNADLCIIDLTEHNPNVFYECGRRHETGKPFIQLLRKGDTLPFDVAGIRTIPYDTSTPRATLESVKAIQAFVCEFEKQGYTPTSSGVSLSSIAVSLDRIERKLISVTGASSSITDYSQLSSNNSPYDSITDSLKHPRQVFMESISLGNMQRAGAILPRLRNLGKPIDFLMAAALIAQAGNSIGMDELIKYFDEHSDSIDYQSFRIILGGMSQYCAVTDTESDNIHKIKEYCNRFLEAHKLEKQEEGFILNQLQRLLYGAGEIDDALEGCLKVIELDPENASYYYNASLIYEKLQQPRRAEAMIDRCLALSDSDADHLSQAVQVYVAVDRIDDARKALNRLTNLDRAKALLLTQFDDEVQEALGLIGKS
jgi:hypothetical protein